MAQHTRQPAHLAAASIVARLSLTGGAALRVGVIACAALALMLAILTRGQAGSPGDAQRLVGQATPQFTLPAVRDGRLLPQPVALLAHQGHPVLLLFTYSLCPHCLAETQTVQQLQQRYAASGLYSTYVDSPAEAIRIVTAYQQRLNLDDPVLLDNDGTVASRFGIHYYPAVVLIDARGVIRYVETGETSSQTLQREIEEVVR